MANSGLINPIKKSHIAHLHPFNTNLTMSAFTLQPRSPFCTQSSSRSIYPRSKSAATTSLPFMFETTSTCSPAKANFHQEGDDAKQRTGGFGQFQSIDFRAQSKKIVLPPHAGFQSTMRTTTTTTRAPLSMRATSLSESSVRSLGITPFFDSDVDDPPSLPYLLLRVDNSDDSFLSCSTTPKRPREQESKESCHPQGCCCCANTVTAIRRRATTTCSFR